MRSSEAGILEGRCSPDLNFSSVLPGKQKPALECAARSGEVVGGEAARGVMHDVNS
jgi:hypothetical protein